MADPYSHPQQIDIAGYLLGNLEADERASVVSHLASCPICRAQLDELAHLPALLEQAPAYEPLPPQLEARTFAAIESAAQIDEVDKTPDVAPTSASGHDIGPIPPSGRGLTPDGSSTEFQPSATSADNVTPIRSVRRRVAMLASAAVVVLVMGIGIGVLAADRTPSTPRLATVHLVSATRGTAHGTAVVRQSPNGLTIQLTVEDLPANPPHTMYTCWLVGAGDTIAHPNRVSVGSFAVSRADATVNVVWNTAADLRQFPELGVTLEPTNGNPSHQGPRILTGSV